MEQTYQELMNQLRTIASRLADARKNYDDTRKALDICKRNVDAEKAEIVISAGGYSALGKNAEDREYKLLELTRKNEYYTAALANQRGAESHEIDAKRALEDLKTEFDSLRIQASLQGDFLKYSALVANKPETASLLDL